MMLHPPQNNCVLLSFLGHLPGARVKANKDCGGNLNACKELIILLRE